jgi:predicted enzyme related to lactoylglutathione lyase
MVTRDTPWPEGTPCWVDLAADDLDKAASFYSRLFGWQVERGGPEMGGYSTALVDGQVVAGLAPKMGPDVPNVWTTYLATEDVERTTQKIVAAGGAVLSPPMDVMDLGRMAIAADPAGAVFGLWQAAKHTGFTRVNEPNTVAWNENLSRDYERNREFYASVFGYHYGDVEGGIRYATLDLPGGMVGGIGELPAEAPKEVPAHWMTYFNVADTDRAVARVRELGGATLQEPFDTPYGRMALVADDQGAAFSVMSAPQSG